MVTSFKPTIQIKLITRTPEDDLIYCTECGGIQAMSQTAIKINCDNCGGTGYENLYTEVPVLATYRPGAVRRYGYESGALVTLGDCSIKLDYKYKELLDISKHIEMDGVNWKFTYVAERGAAMGQPRIVLALSRM
jgi:hypothetical protein